jgi:hypothetical protein
MSNKKLILGIAAGVAALAVVGVVCKKRGYFDNLSTGDFATGIKDKFAGVKETAKKKFDDVVSKGGDIADKFTGHSDNAADKAGKENTAAGKNNTGNAGTNPATI